MTTIHGACCGPSDATNVHRDCPGSWAGWGGEVLVCGCLCHGREGARLGLEIRGNGAGTWENETQAARQSSNSTGPTDSLVRSDRQ